MVYFDQALTQEGVMNINGALFMMLMIVSLDGMFSVVMVFCEELPIFLREHYNGMYR